MDHFFREGTISLYSIHIFEIRRTNVKNVDIEYSRIATWLRIAYYEILMLCSIIALNHFSSFIVNVVNVSPIDI